MQETEQGDYPRQFELLSGRRECRRRRMGLRWKSRQRGEGRGGAHIWGGKHGAQLFCLQDVGLDAVQYQGRVGHGSQLGTLGSNVRMRCLYLCAGECWQPQLLRAPHRNVQVLPLHQNTPT